MKCPNCGKEVANDSSSCKYCGEKIVNPKKFLYKKLWIVIGMIVELGMIGVFIGLAHENSDVFHREIGGSHSTEEVDAQVVEEHTRAEEAAKDRIRQELLSEGYVDLGLPSGTCWKQSNEVNLMTYADAINKYSEFLPTTEQTSELIENCQLYIIGDEAKIVGPNGNYIVLRANKTYDYASFAASYLTLPSFPNYNDYRKVWEMCLHDLFVYKSENGSNMFMHTYGTIEEYKSSRKNTLWGIALCKRVGELAIKRVDDRGANTRKSYTEVYSYDGEYYCDGTYMKDGHTFSSGYLRNLNLDYFRVTFSFKALSYEGVRCNTDIVASQYPIVMSRSLRSLALYLHSDGSIFIETNNGNHLYSTDLRYSPNRYTDIDIEYYKGWLTINGKTMWVDMKVDEYNKDFHSINYSSGNSFKGYIKNIKVYNVTHL